MIPFFFFFFFCFVLFCFLFCFVLFVCLFVGLFVYLFVCLFLFLSFYGASLGEGGGMMSSQLKPSLGHHLHALRALHVRTFMAMRCLKIYIQRLRSMRQG